MTRTDTIRCLYSDMLDFTAFAYENSPLAKVELQKKIGGFIRRQRDKIADVLSLSSDPIDKPLTEGFRTRYDENGEGYIEYGILPDDGYTSDEEIDEYIHDYIELPPIRSPYDCTGKFFTYGVDWKRTPAGIAIVHRVSRDI